MIKCTNNRGEAITFRDSFPFFLESYEGIHEMATVIHTSPTASGKGTVYGGITYSERVITLTIKTTRKNILDKRLELEEMFYGGSTGTLLYKEEEYEREIDYRTSSVDIMRPSNDPLWAFLIVLTCPYPFFRETKDTIITQSGDLFEFPFYVNDFVIGGDEGLLTINNKSVETGMIFELTLTNTSQWRQGTIGLQNTETGERFYAFAGGGAQGQNFDFKKITVDTRTNKKTATYVDRVTGETKGLPYRADSTFLQIRNGMNYFKSISDSDGLTPVEAKIIFRKEYNLA